MRVHDLFESLTTAINGPGWLNVRAHIWLPIPNPDMTHTEYLLSKPEAFGLKRAELMTSPVFAKWFELGNDDGFADVDPKIAEFMGKLGWVRVTQSRSETGIQADTMHNVILAARLIATVSVIKELYFDVGGNYVNAQSVSGPALEFFLRKGYIPRDIASLNR